MYTPYTALLPDVVQALYAEGIESEKFNDNRALYAIRQAYKEFVKDTHIVRREIVIPTQANVSEYALWKYDEHVITKLYSVTVEGADDCHQCYNRGDTCGCQCCDNTFSYDGKFLALCPVPECDGRDITLCVSLMPSSDICQMDERTYEMYGEYIAHGAASKLLSANDGLRYRRYFAIGKDIAQGDAASQWSRAPRTNKRLKWRRR